MKSFEQHQLIRLHDESWLPKLRIAGKAVRQCLDWSSNAIINQEVKNGLEIANKCSEILNDFDCTPTFHNYNGFPGLLCVSVNQALVHSIPNNKPFQKGDVIKVDLGATFQGAIADAATTSIHGGQALDPKHLELIKTTKMALDNGIAIIRVGKRLGCVGNAINKTVNRTRFGLITKYGGHGIYHHITKSEPHAQPFCANSAQSNTGIRFQNNLTLAIEPLLCLGTNETKVAKDGWTVMCNDISCHFEDTIYISDDKVIIITR